MFVGTHTDPAVTDVRIGIQWGANGTEFTGTYAGGATFPNPVVLTLSDRGDGTGADGVISGSTPGATNTVYRAVSTQFPWLWIPTNSIVGDGPIALDTPPGDWVWQVVSSIAGVLAIGTTIQLSTEPAKLAGVYDRGDGTGITVVIQGSDPTAVLTAQLRDTSTDVWRDGPSRVGDGQIIIATGSNPENCTTDRSYYVRVQSIVGAGPPGLSVIYAVQPTEGFVSPEMTLIFQVKRVLLEMNLSQIGGRVFHCIDPNYSIQGVASTPCIFVFEPTPETLASVDNLDTQWTFPVEIGIAQTQDEGVVANLEWWLWVRWTIFNRFHRKPIDLDGNTYGGRKWMATYGPIGIPPPDAKYEYKYQSIILNALYEREIGEV